MLTLQSASAAMPQRPGLRCRRQRAALSSSSSASITASTTRRVDPPRWPTTQAPPPIIELSAAVLTDIAPARRGLGRIPVRRKNTALVAVVAFARRRMGGDLDRMQCGAAREPRPRRPCRDADGRPRASCTAPTTPCISWPRARGSAASFRLRCAFAPISATICAKMRCAAMAGFSFWGQSILVAADRSHWRLQHRVVTRRPPTPPTTPYPALLVAELYRRSSNFIALALFNRFVLAPRIKTSANALADLARDEPRGNRAGLRGHRARQHVCALRSGVKRARPRRRGDRD